MKWFLEQEVSGEAGFDDLVALTQVKMPLCAKLEMARNYWDEMGRGSPKGMHGPMLENLARHLELNSKPRRVVHEAVALGNAMIALAQNRCFAFHSVGALGAIEMTAPTRAGHVARGLKRLGVPPPSSTISPYTPFSTLSMRPRGIARCCIRWSPKIHVARIPLRRRIDPSLARTALLHSISKRVQI